VGPLDKVPAVAVQVFEDGDDAIGFMTGRFEKTDAGGGHSPVIAGEIVGLQEQEDASAGLIADPVGLPADGPS
jgi:hypothetical protein